MPFGKGLAITLVVALPPAVVSLEMVAMIQPLLGSRQSIKVAALDTN